jgi:hypothetical protein
MLMPALLIGLLGVSIPVIVHLLHRQQTQPVQWGAMQFLRASPLQMKKKKKVDHWLLMLMRMVAVAVLAFLLARPRLPQSALIPKELTDSPVDVAVIIDHSLSTGRLSGGQTVFDRAVADTAEIVDQLKRTDTLSIILAEHKPRELNSVPVKKSDTGAIDQLRENLSRQRQGMTDCSIPQAISAARRVLAAGRNSNKQIIILSDQQRTNWHIKDDALWRAAMGGNRSATNLPIHLLGIAPDAKFSNVSVSGLNIQPGVLGIHRPVQISAQVANTGTEPMTGMLAKLIVNGKEIASKPVTPLSPKSSSTIRFDLDGGLPLVGSNWIEVAVNSVDGLAADNQAYAAANVLEKIPVLVIDGQFSNAGSFKSSQFLQAALQPADPSLVQARVISVADAASTRLDDYAVVVLNDLPLIPSELRDRLSVFTRTGRGLWIILGEKTRQTTIEKDLTGLFNAQVREVMNAPANPSGLEVKDSANPVVKNVVGEQRNALIGTATRKWWGLKPADAQVVLSAGNGDPLVMEQSLGTSGGIVDVWASGVDGSWNNWNLIPNFVALVQETVYHLSAVSLHGRENAGLDAGHPIEWAGPAKPAVRSVRIVLPDKNTVDRMPLFNNGRWLLTYPDTFLPGIYTLQFKPPDVAPIYFGINIDRAELDPIALDPDDVNWLKRANYLDASQPTVTMADLPTLLRRPGQAPEIWGILAAVLLASLLLETFLTWRLISPQKRVDVMAMG